ncbi:MAG: hypothetical protein WAS27_03110 [Candidatus Saccharimonadales bacterium]
MDKEQHRMNHPEKAETTTTTTCIAPHGLGFGEGGISVKSQIERGILRAETPKHIHEFLTTDLEAFKTVETTDDGCGDGRPWTKLMQKDDAGNVRFFDKSLLRAKVFGGGLATAASMWRTIHGAPKDHQTVGQDRQAMAEALHSREFSHGAHSDNHAAGDNCGCGAIDKYSAITTNAVKYREEITNTLRAVYGDEFSDNEVEIAQAFDTYEALANHEDYFADASGKQSMEQLIDSGAFVKELGGHHIEETILINDVEGTTLDQQYFTQTVKNAHGPDKPRVVQAFCVDTWRGRQIADVVTEIALVGDPDADVEHVRKLAYADFLIRTLAVAGTLTAGDLPVYRRQVI